jgi:hypothetical protein
VRLWLVGGECVTAASLGMGKRCEKRGKVQSSAPFMGGGERGGVGGPARQHWGTGDLLVWLVFLSRCFERGASLNWYGPHCTPVWSANNCFFYFSK